jgi:hypothetical protein
MRRAQVFEELARSGKNIVMSGGTGESLLSQLISVDGNAGAGAAQKKK